MTAFIDTNVVIEILRPAGQRQHWALSRLLHHKALGPVLITDIVWCEFSVGMASIVDASAAIDSLALERFQPSDEALFRAGKAFKKYKEVNKGTKEGVLPDFIIGAIAEVEGWPLITMNEKDYKGYFSALALDHP